MDSVYSLYNAVSSSKINIGEYFENYHKVISEEKCKQSQKNEGCSTASYVPSSLEEEEKAILAAYCSVDKLKVPGELPKVDNKTYMKRGRRSMKGTEIPKGTGLATLSKLDETYKTQKPLAIETMRKYMGEIAIRYEKSECRGPRAIPEKDVSVFIRVYRPFTAQALSSAKRKIVLSSVIAILGSQTLDKLRDLIDCVSDLSVAKEVSENPDVPVESIAKDIYKSGFFYIEGTFYNDFREKNTNDNSRVIREWAESRNLGPFATSTMEDVRIDSLTVRFGYPWVYQHQGNCEHLLVFSDARLLNADDELAVSAYPRIHRLKHRRSRCCMTCGLFGARWIVIDSDRIPHNPCFLCAICFKAYNYIDGKKVGNFKAYRYPHHPELMWNDESPLKKALVARKK